MSHRHQGSHSRPSWSSFVASDFDPAPYNEVLPSGAWEAVVEKSTWPKRASGIHLFLFNCSDGQRYWTFVWWDCHDLYELFRTLPDGSRVRLRVGAGTEHRRPRLESAHIVEAQVV